MDRTTLQAALSETVQQRIAQQAAAKARRTLAARQSIQTVAEEVGTREADATTALIYAAAAYRRMAETAEAAGYTSMADHYNALAKVTADYRIKVRKMRERYIDSL